VQDGKFAADSFPQGGGVGLNMIDVSLSFPFRPRVAEGKVSKSIATVVCARNGFQGFILCHIHVQLGTNKSAGIAFMLVVSVGSLSRSHD
jgi:hypothetical protein